MGRLRFSRRMFNSLYLRGLWFRVWAFAHSGALIAKDLIVRQRGGRDFCFRRPERLSDCRRRQVGWVVASHLTKRRVRFEHLHDSLKMRVANIALWINEHADSVCNSMYDPGRQYDLVIFFKAMSREDIEEARKIKAYGGRVLFDANVNYYEEWGEYKAFSNRLHADQRKTAIEMTSLADLCVGDSTKLCEIAGKYNPSIYHVPDNVDLHTFRFVRRHCPVKPVRLVWSGISFKAFHLLLIEEIFPQLDDVELVLVSEKRPPIMDRLSSGIRCRFVPYSDAGYARVLAECDVIISPKELVNAYEVGHTEYKITLGMAAGLPVVASPLQSYVEALSEGGGIIASTDYEWLSALKELTVDYELRAEMGRKALQTVVDYYSTPVVSSRYLKVIEEGLSL